MLVLMSQTYKNLVPFCKKMMKNALGNRIRMWRTAYSMTQGELAAQLGGKKSLVSNYENGYSVPDIFTLIRLADIFDVTLDELVGRDK